VKKLGKRRGKNSEVCPRKWEGGKKEYLTESELGGGITII